MGTHLTLGGGWSGGMNVQMFISLGNDKCEGFLCVWAFLSRIHRMIVSIVLCVCLCLMLFRGVQYYYFCFPLPLLLLAMHLGKLQGSE